MPGFLFVFCFVVENDGFCILILYYLCLDFDFLVACISVNLWEETCKEIDILHTIKREYTSCTKTHMGALHFVTVEEGIQSGMAVISELNLPRLCSSASLSPRKLLSYKQDIRPLVWQSLTNKTLMKLLLKVIKGYTLYKL